MLTKPNFRILSALAVGAVLCTAAFVTQGHAATVVKTTSTTQQEIDGTKKINFAAFDLNHDGTLSRSEVGAELFYIFDTDGNEVIDNIEYGRPMVLTIIPMEKQEITSIDFDDDGTADSTKLNTEEFFQKSMLARFDKQHKGLSAQEFLKGRYYWTLDDNHDKVVDIKEFKAAYIAATKPTAANPNRYNN